MTTLADLTEEQRDQCEGTWAKVAGCVLGIIAHVGDRNAYMIIPADRREATYPLNRITPCPELPRAWHPDGTPPEGEWLTAGSHTRVIPKNRRAFVTMSEPEPQTGEQGESK